jgi:hypothetical protein
VPVPSRDEWADVRRELTERARSAVATLAVSPSPARPSADNCRYCGVRQLCDEYWGEGTKALTDGERRIDVVGTGDFIDLEVDLTGRHGPTTWSAVTLSAKRLPAGAKVIINPTRSDRETQAILDLGGRVRIIGARFLPPDPLGADVNLISVSQFSEVYSCKIRDENASGNLGMFQSLT